MLPVYTATIFVSATLLFLVQPMFSKQVLPLLGGTPAVWNTSMLFFQAALLAGYGYAHLTTRWLGAVRQARVHLVLLVASLLALPIGIARGWTPPSDGSPVSWLLLLLSVSIGVPFFILSCSSPLLQTWFSRTGHKEAADPYFLYAASNLGSFAALVSYPLLIEPRMRLGAQNWTWSAAYAALVLLTGVCAVLLWRTAGAQPEARSARPDEADLVSSRDRLSWVLLSFAPSSLLLGVTNYLTTDVAAVPLLWVIPLALYLLTFVLVFARAPILRHEWMVRVQPILVLMVVVAMFWGMRNPVSLFFPLHLGAFFLTTMVCHGELAKRRPSVRHLTEFYLWISVGGVLGGIFNVLVAPHVFNTVLEYPLALALACALRPKLLPDTPRRKRLDLLLPALFGAAFVGLAWAALSLSRGEASKPVIAALGVVAAVVCLSFSMRPLRFGLGVAAVLLTAIPIEARQGGNIHVARTFFGVHKVGHDAPGRYHKLMHGTTVHGGQSLDPARRLEPLTYYTKDGPLGQVFAGLRRSPGPRRVAVVGLGAGAISCYGVPGERWTYYEIDPEVERIARDPRLFTYLRDCPPHVNVVLGDARLSLTRAPAGEFDLIVVDAFSSDAIPMHLMTREALALYRSKLANGGLVAFHISNVHLDLEPVVANLAWDARMIGRVRAAGGTAQMFADSLHTPSTWAVLAGRAADLGILRSDERWRSLVTRPNVGVWTDDFSNILRVRKWR